MRPSGATARPSRPDAAEVALIHRRLSIIDLDPRANQPMASADGRYVIVFNGEIYNFVELREALRRDGHVFRTTSDTEVLIAAYAAWGEAALARFTGMYAFVLLDRQRRELFVARDPFGIKPLFFARGSGHLAFASEIGPLLDVPGVGRGIDLSRTCLFLSVGQTDESERTMFADVRSLPAGHFARIPLDKPAVVPVPFWRPTIAVARAKPRGGGPRVARGAHPFGRASSAQRRADRDLALRRHRFLRDHRLRPRGRRAVRRTCAPSASSRPVPRSTRRRSSRWRRGRRAPTSTPCGSSPRRSSPTSIG